MAIKDRIAERIKFQIEFQNECKKEHIKEFHNKWNPVDRTVALKPDGYIGKIKL